MFTIGTQVIDTHRETYSINNIHKAKINNSATFELVFFAASGRHITRVRLVLALSGYWTFETLL